MLLSLHYCPFLYQLLPSFPSTLPGPSHIQTTATSRWSWPFSWGQHQPNHWLILWQWRLFHPIMWRLTKSSGTSLACLIYILISLCGTFWCSSMLPCVWLGGFLLRMCVWAQGWRCPMCSSVWFVMFPFLSLLSAGSWKQHRDVSSPIESAVSKNSLYARTTNYIEGESPHLPKELDHSLGIAREEVPQKCFVLLY